MGQDSQFPGLKVAFFRRKTFLRTIIIFLLFILAFGIRLYHINQPPIGYHPTRQYRSLIIARGMYYNMSKSIPDVEKQIGIKNMNMERILEPPVMEFVTAFIYKMVNGDYIWIPQLLSVLFWMVGGGFLFLIARKIVGEDSAVISIIIYLFLPFSICASRSFQPDSMMVMLILASLYGMILYFENPSLSGMLITAFVSSIALLIKPLCVFYIYGVFLSFSVARMNRDNWKSDVIPSCFIYCTFSLLPSIAYYCYGLFFAGFLQGETGGRILPHLLLELSFWKGWANMIGRVVGHIILFGSFVGLLMAKGKQQRPMLLGLWGGYVSFGLVITYQMHNHDYYHLPFIPVAAMSIAPLVILLINRANKKNVMVVSAVCLALMISVSIYFTTRVELIPERPYVKMTPEIKSRLKIFGNLLGLNPQFAAFLALSFNKEVNLDERIGEEVGHSERTLLLASAYGKSLKYHGVLSGDFWPAQGDLKWLEMRGINTLSVEERFNQLVKGKSPEYFIVSNFRLFNEQPDLKDFLYGMFPLLVENDTYLIFDLRGN